MFPPQVHGSQSIEILKPLPLSSGPGWKWKTKYTGISENSESNLIVIYKDMLIRHPESGVVITAENLLVDPHDIPYAKLYVRVYTY